MGVVVDPVQHLADRLLGERRQRLVQRGVEQVGAQPALGPVDDTGPQRAAGGVEDRGADDAEREQPDQRRRGVLGQLPRDQRAQGGADGGDRARTPAPTPARDRAASASRRCGRGSSAAAGTLSGALELGGGHRSRPYDGPPTGVARFFGPGAVTALPVVEASRFSTDLLDETLAETGRDGSEVEPRLVCADEGGLRRGHRQHGRARPDRDAGEGCRDLCRHQVVDAALPWRRRSTGPGPG